ncbi:MAG: DedA family protein [Bacteroidales bacterium]|jgi:membrane protein YqaA with SNARE-associated domain|nr:DedA family protein [Bacteroidales bacterium]
MLENLGLFGLFLACLLSATIIPFSSEAIVAGAMALGYSTPVIVGVASLGNTVGGMISFYMGWLCKWEWLERWFKVKREKLESFRGHIEKYGVWAALLTWLPFVGDPLAIAMGFMRLNPLWTCLIMFVGKLLRYFVSSYLLGLTGLF